MVLHAFLLMLLLIFRMDFYDLTAVHHEEIVAAASPPPPTPGAVPLAAGLAQGLSDNPDLQEVLERVPALHAVATHCFLAAKAPGTVRSYNAAIRRFQSFCEKSVLPFPAFTSDTVIQYVLHLESSQAPFSYFKTLKPALCYFEAAQGSTTVFNPTIDLLISGAERCAGAATGPMKKATLLPVASIHALLTTEFLPHVDNIQTLCPILFRTLFRVVFIYHTLCRLACLRQLRARHFELVGDDILVTFPSFPYFSPLPQCLCCHRGSPPPSGPGW